MQTHDFFLQYQESLIREVFCNCWLDHLVQSKQYSDLENQSQQCNFSQVAYNTLLVFRRIGKLVIQRIFAGSMRYFLLFIHRLLILTNLFYSLYKICQFTLQYKVAKILISKIIVLMSDRQLYQLQQNVQQIKLMHYWYTIQLV